MKKVHKYIYVLILKQLAEMQSEEILDNVTTAPTNSSL